MTRSEKITCALMVIYALLVCAFIWSTPAHGQRLVQDIVLDTPQAREVVKREGNIEVTRGIAPDTYTAKIYATDQYDKAGEPLLRSPVDGTFWSGNFYVRYTPDGVTAKLAKAVTRSNVTVKEEITLLDATVGKLSWRVGTNAVPTITNEQLVFTDVKGNFLFRSPAPVAWDADGKPVQVTATFKDWTLTYTVALDGAKFPVTVDPTVTVNDTDANTGTLSSSDPDLSAARNATTGTVNANQLGVRYDFAGTNGNIERAFLQFDTSTFPNLAAIDSVKVNVVVSAEGAVEPGLYLFIANFTGDIAEGWYNDFYGWAATGAYPTDFLASTASVSSYSAGDTLRFKLNQAGLDSLNITGNSKYAILSTHDVGNNAGGADIRSVTLEDDSPYIQVWYRASPILPRRTLFNSTGQVLWDKTYVPLWQP